MPVIKVITTKSFIWRGSEEEWSNGYHLSVATPPVDRAARSALVDAIWNIEKTLSMSGNILVSALYYSNPAGVSDESFTYPLRGAAGVRGATGTAMTGGTNVGWQPETCLLVKAQAGRTAKGRPRYLTKYYHSLGGPAGESAAAWAPAINTAVTPLIDGSLPGGAKWCSPGGIVATGIGLDQYTRIHQLKRRGKRPQTP